MSLFLANLPVQIPANVSPEEDAAEREGINSTLAPLA